MEKMEKVVIEVCPRIGDGDYHASIKGNCTWDCGRSIEEAVAACIATYHDPLKLSTMDLDVARRLNYMQHCHANESFVLCSSRNWLRRLISLLAERGFEIEVIFLPNEIR